MRVTILMTFMLCFLMVLTGCNNSNNAADGGRASNDSATKQVYTDPNEKFFGYWKAGDDPNATFVFNKDSIFYTEPMTNYPYKINGDTISIDFFDSIYKGAIKLEGDTLVMTSPDLGTMKFTRFKE